jgi:hypothetical protein
MSPRVTLTISAADLEAIGKTPLTHLLEAVAAMQARRVWMRCGDPGVLPGMFSWRVDRHVHPRGVSLVGAVLLHLQPEPGEGEEPLAAAARALGVSLAWVEGAETGWCDELMDTAWLARPDADLYLDGHEVGSQVRAVFEGAR